MKPVIISAAKERMWKKLNGVLDTDNIQVNEFGDLYRDDYPDMVDAYVSDAQWISSDEWLTDEELDKLNSGDYDEFVQELACEWLMCHG